MKKHITDNQKGFTLIELMVALMLFTIVVLAAVSSLYTVNRASRRVEAMRTVLDNLNFAIESMSRTIRTGTDIGGNGVYGFDFPFDSGPAGDIILQSTFGDVGTVRYQRGQNGNGTGSIQKRVGNGPWISLTSPEIDVQTLSFYVEGSCPPSGIAFGGAGCDNTTVKQPSVAIFITGVATAAGDTAPFAVQTYVSQRAVE